MEDTVLLIFLTLNNKRIVEYTRETQMM